MRKSALYGFGLVVACLVALGLVILTSASGANGWRIHHDVYFFVKRQFVYLGVGLLVAVFAAWFDYRNWVRHPALTWSAYGLVLLLLALVFPPFGRAINGSYRWISLGFINLQPSEFAKLMTVIAVAVWLDRAGWHVELFWRGAFCAAAIFGVLAAPVLFEPDFGSVMVIALVGLLLMFAAGVKVLHLSFFGLAGFAVLAAKVMSNANRMARIAAWLGIKIDVGAEVVDEAAARAADQARNALVAIKNGGYLGVGLNQSMQKQYYLPEAHTDFIFAIGAEELGLGFSIGVLVLFLAFFALSIYIASKASDRFGRLLVIGMAFILFFQGMFNLGVVCEALPTKGMALPFFSYGGTNMLSAFFAVGTILSVGIHTWRDRKRAVSPPRERGAYEG